MFSLVSFCCVQLASPKTNRLRFGGHLAVHICCRLAAFKIVVDICLHLCFYKFRKTIAADDGTNARLIANSNKYITIYICLTRLERLIEQELQS